MASLDPFGYGTHEVLNQAPAMADYDAYGHDPALAKILSTFNAEWAAPHARAVGNRIASARVQELARQANRNLPELRTHDRWGRRIDQIEFHPAWHELMTLAMRDEFHSLCWTKPRPGAQMARAAVSYLWNQGENGVCCPLGMTYSAIPILRRDPARWAARWLDDEGASESVAEALASPRDPEMKRFEVKFMEDVPNHKFSYSRVIEAPSLETATRLAESWARRTDDDLRSIDEVP
jgi:hypothetical protein